MPKTPIAPVLVKRPWISVGISSQTPSKDHAAWFLSTAAARVGCTPRSHVSRAPGSNPSASVRLAAAEQAGRSLVPTLSIAPPPTGDGLQKSSQPPTHPSSPLSGANGVRGLLLRTAFLLNRSLPADLHERSQATGCLSLAYWLLRILASRRSTSRYSQIMVTSRPKPRYHSNHFGARASRASTIF